MVPPALYQGGWLRQSVHHSIQVPPLRFWPPLARDPALLTLPSIFPPALTVPSTVQSRRCRQLQSRVPIAPSVWSLWRIERPLKPWCAQRAKEPGSTGTASRSDPSPWPRGAAGAQQHQGLAHTACVCPAGTGHARWSCVPPLPPVQRWCGFRCRNAHLGDQSWCPSAWLTRQEGTGAVSGHVPAVLALPCPLRMIR